VTQRAALPHAVTLRAVLLLRVLIPRATMP
jgi:hypothetical protein